MIFDGQAEEDEDNGISDSQAAMLEAKIDPVEWKRELERVGPRLKVRTSFDAMPYTIRDFLLLSGNVVSDQR